MLQSDVSNMERILQALVVSQYRKKVAEKYGIIPFKPVVLVKTKSKANAEETFELFQQMLSKLNADIIKEIIPKDEEDNLLNRAFNFYQSENIDYDHLAEELKIDFSDEKQMIIYSGNDEEEKQLLLNNLEDRDNPIRIIFVVKKLTEGWDVLNLFDIVRTDENAVGGKTPTQDAQLIGRGARYFPFQLDEEQPKFQRKYDENTEHPLRVLEELCYYSLNHPTYIRNLHKQLDKIGLGDKEKQKVQLKLKPSFKDSPLYKTGYVFLNKQERKDLRRINSFQDLGVHKKDYEVKLKTGSVKEIDILEEEIDIGIEKLDRKPIPVSSIPFIIIRKALQKDPFFYFNNLKNYFPNLKSINEFIKSEDYLGQVTISIWLRENNDIHFSPDQYLFIVVKMLEQLRSDIKSFSSNYIGTKEFYPKKIKDLPFEKEMEIIRDVDKNREQSSSTTEDYKRFVKVEEENWFVYEKAYRNTSEEQLLIRLIYDMYNQYKDEFKQFYLIRNEKLFKLYRFSDGKGFEPDFLVIAKRVEDDKEVVYQIFIEPKGEQLEELDREKEKFLREIRENAELYIEKNKKMLFYNSDDYQIYGLPFFNHKKERAFREEYLKIFEQ